MRGGRRPGPHGPPGQPGGAAGQRRRRGRQLGLRGRPRRPGSTRPGRLGRSPCPSRSPSGSLTGAIVDRSSVACRPGCPPLAVDLRLRPCGRPAEGDRHASPRASRAATASRRCSASPGRARAPPSPGRSSRCRSPRWSSPPTSRWPPSWPTSSGSSSPTTGSSTSSATTTTTSPRPTSASSDTYIEKDSSINDEIDRLRHSATVGPAHPPGRDRGGLGVVHLRPRLARGVPRAACSTCRSGSEHDQRSILRKLVDMQYERNDMNLVPRQVPGAGRHHRGAPRLRGDGGPHRAVRRRDRAHPRSSTRSPASSSRVLDDLIVFPATHYVAGEERMREGHRAHRGGAAGAAGLLREGGQAARGPAPAHAHPVRPRDDAGGRVLQRHRELLGAHRRPRPGRGRPTRCSTSSPTTSCWSSTRAT